MAEPTDGPPSPDMTLASDLHLLSLSPADKSLSGKVFDKIVSLKAKGLHSKYASKYGWPALPASVATEYAEEEEELLAKITTLEKDSGDTDVLDAHKALAKFYACSLSYELAIARYEVILKLPKTGTSSKITALLAIMRLHLFRGAPEPEVLAQCEGLLEVGGDWDKRNRVKVYTSLSLCLTREYLGAAPLLLSCVKTFSCEELLSFDTFVNLTVVLNLLTLPRPQLKEHILDSPEILGGISQQAKALVDSFYACDYAEYMRAVVAMEEPLQQSPYLHSHTTQIIRQLTVLGYAQFLQSYRTVTLTAMADAFAVSVPYLDLQLSTFIATSSLQCKIDAVSGTVETVRVEGQEKGYRKVVEEGDRVLNKILQLARVVDV
jgi:26S proteasome regulatory subunit N7